MADTILKFRIPEAKAGAVLALLERNLDRREDEGDKAFAHRYFRDHLINLDYRDRRRGQTPPLPDNDLITDEL